MTAAQQMSEPDGAEILRLRAPPPQVTRISRKVLIALASVSALVVTGAVAWAMTDHRTRKAAPELYSVGGQPPERLNTLPRDYAAPKLGPPLPGDLGRPIAESGAPAPDMSAGSGAQVEDETVRQAAEARLQQRAQERDAARTSRLFATDAQSAPVSMVLASGAGDPDLADVAGAAGRRTILDGPVDRRTTSPDRLQSPASPYVIQAGRSFPPP